MTASREIHMKVVACIVYMSFALLSACASTKESVESIERRNYNSWENEIGYSQVVRAGKTLYVSGIASNKPTLEQQVEEIYSVIARILSDYGLTTGAIVKQVIYTTDIDAYKSLGAVRKRSFAENRYPSSTLVQIERLYDVSHLVEIEVVAHIE